MSYKKPDYDAAYTRRVEKMCWVIYAGVVIALGVIVCIAVYRLRTL